MNNISRRTILAQSPDDGSGADLDQERERPDLRLEQLSSLQTIAAWLVEVEPGGMSELHWHPWSN